jgi:hypothetical protein
MYYGGKSNEDFEFIFNVKECGGGSVTSTFCGDPTNCPFTTAELDKQYRGAASTPSGAESDRGEARAPGSGHTGHKPRMTHPGGPRSGHHLSSCGPAPQTLSCLGITGEGSGLGPGHRCVTAAA